MPTCPLWSRSDFQFRHAEDAVELRRWWFLVVVLINYFRFSMLRYIIEIRNVAFARQRWLRNICAGCMSRAELFVK